MTQPVSDRIIHYRKKYTNWPRKGSTIGLTLPVSSHEIPTYRYIWDSLRDENFCQNTIIYSFEGNCRLVGFHLSSNVHIRYDKVSPRRASFVSYRLGSHAHQRGAYIDHPTYICKDISWSKFMPFFHVPLHNCAHFHCGTKCG